MPIRKCDECGKLIERHKEVELKLPDKYCEHCKSDTYSEYRVCSLSCAKALIEKEQQAELVEKTNKN